MTKVVESTINIADEPENYYVVHIVQCRKDDLEVYGCGTVIKMFDLPHDEARGFLLEVRRIKK